MPHNLISLVAYSEQYESAWDNFIKAESINGTFLQTRNFLNYHPADRFCDNSLLFMKGNNIIAVMPANKILNENDKILFSHMGSTFGGIILGKQYKKITDVEKIFEELNAYLVENHYSEIILKLTSRIYAKDESELLEYYLFLNGFTPSFEMGYFIDFRDYNDETINNYNLSRRRGYRHSLKNELSFELISSNDEIKKLYLIISDNHMKFDKLPVHTLEELLEFKNNRIKDNIKFYGVYHKSDLIAGSVVFSFDKRVFHTQYLAAKQDMLSFYPSEFLYTGLIETAREEGYEMISFGTSTLEHGKILNKSLAQFKEGFGTREYINKTFSKRFE